MFRRALRVLRRLAGYRDVESSASVSEERVRVLFTLPCQPDTDERKAMNEVIEYLQQQRTKRIGVDGFTYSDVSNPVFLEYWWSEEQNAWIQDLIVLFIVDYLRPSTERRYSLTGKLAQLKHVIAEAYKNHRSRQDEVWIIFHDVLRQP